MQVARPTFFGKGRVLSSVTRNTSCKNGWLRLVVQSIFATITVISFILIVIMALKNPNPAPVQRPLIPPKCQIHGCRVTCKDAPYFNEYEDDILFHASEAETRCTRVVLELQSPHFVNNTLPDNWLSKMHSHIYSLIIIGGNLMHIPSGAFMSQFAGNTMTLVLQELYIKSWEPTSLVGLSSLRTINILNCQLGYVQENALKAVDDTLETLTITETGIWNPYNFTGMTGFQKLTTVDFSYNDFGDILGAVSFLGLTITKILYLNSCRITSLGAGVFDNLLRIEVLYLNNNLLVTVPSGVFNNIVALEDPRPRINLHDNFWYCDCSVDDLRQLVRKDLLLVDPKCTYPEEMHSITFTNFENLCTNDTLDTEYRFRNVTLTSQNSQSKVFVPDPVYINSSHCGGRKNANAIRIISPIHKSKCNSKKIKHLDVAMLADRTGHEINKEKYYNKSSWPQFYHFFTTDLYSMVQIGSTEKQRSNYGLVWYRNSCPYELFCLDELPNFLRVYNTDSNARYTFCLINLDSVLIENEYCIGYQFSTNETYSNNGLSRTSIVILIFTMVVCLSFGAIMVYSLIRLNPTLLKGSKRILFVKHKNVDALVLPPKVPIRNDLKAKVIDFKNKDIFTLSPDYNLKSTDLNRIKSVRSNKSGSPSYISAMQPTEDQLAEWRIRQHFNNDLTINSMKSDLSTLSCVCGDTICYHSLNESDRTYESLK